MQLHTKLAYVRIFNKGMIIMFLSLLLKHTFDWSDNWQQIIESEVLLTRTDRSNLTTLKPGCYESRNNIVYKCAPTADYI